MSEWMNGRDQRGIWRTSWDRRSVRGPYGNLSDAVGVCVVDGRAGLSRTGKGSNIPEKNDAGDDSGEGTGRRGRAVAARMEEGGLLRAIVVFQPPASNSRR